MNPAMVSGDDDGSSIPAGASFYRFVPVINRLTKDFLTGASLSVVHSMKAFRAFNADGSPRAFFVNLGMHTTVNVNPRLAQYLLSGRDEVSVFAERLQLGYLFDGSKVFRVRTYPNLSLVGFSFDCTAWFEIDDVKLTSLTFQPVLRLRLHSRDPGGPEPHRIDFMGDDVINKGPFWQPALTIDLTRVPDRGPRTSPPGP